MEIKTVGVIGAGVIGVGVAQNLAQTGHNVILVDISNEILSNAKNQIINGIKLQSLFKQSHPDMSKDEILNKITFTTDYKLLLTAEAIIENVTEKIEIKNDVYKQIDKICQDKCIFAVNTSAVPISLVASITNRPEKILGIHFMNPVPLKKTVEVIRGSQTSEETIRLGGELLKAMEKEYIIVNDSPGFVSNRVLMLTINEAAHLVNEKVAAVKDIDNIFKACFGHKMGPLETADLIGIDTIVNTLEILKKEFNDNKFSPCNLLEEMMAMGNYGRKSDKGFYDYYKG